jgi:hypothetical protein
MLGRTATKTETSGAAQRRRARPVIRSRPPEISAIALVARPGSISGALTGFAQAGAERALNKSAKPIPVDTHVSKLFFIVKTSS